jgi:alpha-amylase
MPKVCIYLQLHQPYRLRELDMFSVGSMIQTGKNYFHTSQKDDNRKIFQKVARKSYLPMLTLLAELLRTNPEFSFSLSVSGVFLEQALEYEPTVIEKLQKLAQSNRVEFLAETYYHSLAALYSENEFAFQVRQHQELLTNLFSRTPQVFRNTELIYSDQIGEQVAKLGYSGLITEAVPRYLGTRKKTQVYSSFGENNLPLLLKHAEFSDDIAFRFSDKNWPEFPLDVYKYCEWLEKYSAEEYINLFMDFETFGEHQWEDTGIFSFFKHFIEHFNSVKYNKFVLPTDIFLEETPVEQYAVPEPISWADVDRDLTAWRGNALQEDSLHTLYGLEKSVLHLGNEQLLKDWRMLQTSDHFYYMCAKWAADGDVHAYFSPYDSPYEAYRRYSFALADLQERIRTLEITARHTAQPLPSVTKFSYS